MNFDVGSIQLEACGVKVDVSGTKPGAGGINADVGGTNVDVGGRKADTGGMKAHVDGTKFDVGGRNADVDGTKTDVGSSKFDVGGWVCSEPVMVTSDEVSATAVSSVRAVTLADTVDRLSVVGIAEALFVAPASNKQHHITLKTIHHSQWRQQTKNCNAHLIEYQLRLG